MVIAALVCFAILLIAWIVAPNDAPPVASVSEPQLDLSPLLEAA